MKVVITDQTFPNIAEEQKALDVLPDLQLIDGRCTCEADIIAACGDADGILNRYNYITEQVIYSLKKCRVISTYGIGLDRIDVEAASRSGIYVCNSPDYNQSEVSDHIVTMLLALSRHLFTFDKRIRQGDFTTPYQTVHPRRLSTQTAGFVGFGRIAGQAAEKLRTAFGMKIMCFDPFLTDEQVAARHATRVDLKTLLRESDYLSINVSLLPTTRNLIGAKEIALMKPSAFLINCSRGGVVDEAALVDALTHRRIAGAGLDTFGEEPLPASHPLCSLENVILTPHVAWYTMEAIANVQKVAAEQVALVLSGKQPTLCVNLDAVEKNL
ncbi:MAG: C-terminal binding protein [Oscillibacter sp.]|jgi:D-3-phosphoglycerate dehydrogenase|nr:C-terminal binding protein [Oscillibacter sp.]